MDSSAAVVFRDILRIEADFSVLHFEKSSQKCYWLAIKCNHKANCRCFKKIYKFVKMVDVLFEFWKLNKGNPGICPL
jgi:hypothetical protein